MHRDSGGSAKNAGRGAGKVDGLLLGMLAAVALASVAPQLGRTGGRLHIEHYTDAGIFLLFFLHGVNISTESLRQGAAQWRLHVLVQSCTYLVFPLWWLALHTVLHSWVSEDLNLGFFYLSVVPSTVATAVATTTIARGNVVAAVLNATLSTFLGVVLTPLWVGLMAQGSGHHMDFAHTMTKIAQLLLLPFLVGQALRPRVGGWFTRIRPVTSVADRLIIVMLVWTTFSDSVAGGLWSRNGPAVLGMALVGVAMFLLPMLTFSRWAARRLGLGIEDEITAVMCGSKKSMASGVPMAKLLFGSHAALGLVVLPLLFYHQMQLFVCTWLARRYARRPTAS